MSCVNYYITIVSINRSRCAPGDLKKKWKKKKKKKERLVLTILHFSRSPNHSQGTV